MSTQTNRDLIRTQVAYELGLDPDELRDSDKGSLNYAVAAACREAEEAFRWTFSKTKIELGRIRPTDDESPNDYQDPYFTHGVLLKAPPDAVGYFGLSRQSGIIDNPNQRSFAPIVDLPFKPDADGLHVNEFFSRGYRYYLEYQKAV